MTFLCLLLSFLAVLAGPASAQNTNNRLAVHCSSPNRLFPDPDDCRKFIRCVNGKAVTFTCPPLTAFDPETQVCDWRASSVRCGKAVKPTSSNWAGIFSGVLNKYETKKANVAYNESPLRNIRPRVWEPKRADEKEDVFYSRSKAVKENDSRNVQYNLKDAVKKVQVEKISPTQFGSQKSFNKFSVKKTPTSEFSPSSLLPSSTFSRISSALITNKNDDARENDESTTSSKYEREESETTEAPLEAETEDSMLNEETTETATESTGLPWHTPTSEQEASTEGNDKTTTTTKQETTTLNPETTSSQPITTPSSEEIKDETTFRTTSKSENTDVKQPSSSAAPPAKVEAGLTMVSEDSSDDPSSRVEHNEAVNEEITSAEDDGEISSSENEISAEIGATLASSKRNYHTKKQPSYRVRKVKSNKNFNVRNIDTKNGFVKVAIKKNLDRDSEDERIKRIAKKIVAYRVKGIDGARKKIVKVRGHLPQSQKSNSTRRRVAIGKKRILQSNRYHKGPLFIGINDIKTAQQNKADRASRTESKLVEVKQAPVLSPQYLTTASQTSESNQPRDRVSTDGLVNTHFTSPSAWYDRTTTKPQTQAETEYTSSSPDGGSTHPRTTKAGRKNWYDDVTIFTDDSSDQTKMATTNSAGTTTTSLPSTQFNNNIRNSKSNNIFTYTTTNNNNNNNNNNENNSDNNDTISSNNNIKVIMDNRNSYSRITTNKDTATTVRSSHTQQHQSSQESQAPIQTSQKSHNTGTPTYHTSYSTKNPASSSHETSVTSSQDTTDVTYTTPHDTGFESTIDSVSFQAQGKNNVSFMSAPYMATGLVRPFKCPSPDGHFPDPKNCAVYYHCSDDVAYRRDCPSGQLFHQGVKSCVSKTLVPPCAHAYDDKLEDASDLAKTICKTPDGLYRDPYSCEFYFECTEGWPLHRKCMAGTVFDQARGKCTWSKFVPGCEQDDDEGTENNVIAEEDVVDFDCPRDGYFRDDDSCTVYYLCAGGQPLRMSCDPGTSFDTTLNMCAWDSLVDGCHDDDEDDDEEKSEEEDESELTDTLVMPDHEEYILDNTVVSHLEDVEKMVKKTGGFKCPRAEGSFEDLTDCTVYYSCTNGEPERMRCPHGTGYDVTTGLCVDARQLTSCKTNTEDFSSMLDNAPNAAAFLCPESHGLYPEKDNCSTFIHCFNGKAYRHSCQEGTFFSVDMAACTWPHLVPECAAAEDGEDDSLLNRRRNVKGVPFQSKFPFYDYNDPYVPQPAGLRDFECPENDNNFHRDNLFCDIFHRCSESVKYTFTCPTGTFFRIGKNICDFWDAVPDCTPDGIRVSALGSINDIGPEPTYNKPPGSSSRDPAYTIPERNTPSRGTHQGPRIPPRNPAPAHNHRVNSPPSPAFQSVPEESKGAKLDVSPVPCPASSGLFAHPRNCQQFLFCAHRIPLVLTCPESLLYNSLTLTCDYAANVRCMRYDSIL